MHNTPEATFAQVWLRIEAHFFCRPNVSCALFLDLDDYESSLQPVLQLAPRAVVQTSQCSYQAWYTMDQRHAPREVATATVDLAKAMRADLRSAKPSQLGRMPGSVNRKPEKQTIALLLLLASADVALAT